MMGRALVEAVADLERNGGERGYGEVVNDGGLDPDTGQGASRPPIGTRAPPRPVLVDEETGEVSVERLHAAVYAGRVVDRGGAELQNEGSMIMGLGTALFEQVDQADGQLTGTNLSDYNMPAIHDLPGRFTHQLIESEAQRPTVWARPPCRRCPPRSATALGSLGLELTELPMTAERVLAAADALGPQARMIVELLLNGRRAELETAGAETLLETLRREGLLSVRATCGIGVCGACTDTARRRARVGVA